jgi:hypothetical protein
MERSGPEHRHRCARASLDQLGSTTRTAQRMERPGPEHRHRCAAHRATSSGAPRELLSAWSDLVRSTATAAPRIARPAREHHASCSEHEAIWSGTPPPLRRTLYGQFGSIKRVAQHTARPGFKHPGHCATHISICSNARQQHHRAGCYHGPRITRTAANPMSCGRGPVLRYDTHGPIGGSKDCVQGQNHDAGAEHHGVLLVIENCRSFHGPVLESTRAVPAVVQKTPDVSRGRVAALGDRDRGLTVQVETFQCLAAANAQTGERCRNHYVPYDAIDQLIVRRRGAGIAGAKRRSLRCSPPARACCRSCSP